MQICHVLGSNIPHHNRTLLTFFLENSELYSLVQHHEFYVVGEPIDTVKQLPIRYFKRKGELAYYLLQLHRKENKRFYFFHGQFNHHIWLMILFGLLSSQHIGWHIWGADCYEQSNKLRFKLFYPIRRMAQRRITQVYGTQGDLVFFNKINPSASQTQLYFPAKEWKGTSEENDKNSESLTILVGNSGDPANLHVDTLYKIKSVFGKKVKLLIPMGYPANNERYIDTVSNVAKALFEEENIFILHEKLDFEDYYQRLRKVDLAYLGFERQQGIGTITLLIKLNIPFVLNDKNPFCLDLDQQNIPFVKVSELVREQYDFIDNIRKQLKQVEYKNIAFFEPQLQQNWQNLLTSLNRI